jgi:hypothetical protein
MLTLNSKTLYPRTEKVEKQKIQERDEKTRSIAGTASSARTASTVSSTQDTMNSQQRSNKSISSRKRKGHNGDSHSHRSTSYFTSLARYAQLLAQDQVACTLLKGLICTRQLEILETVKQRMGKVVDETDDTTRDVHDTYEDDDEAEMIYLVKDMTKRYQRFLIRSHLFPALRDGTEAKQQELEQQQPLGLNTFQIVYLELEILHAIVLDHLECFQIMFMEDRIWLRTHMEKLITAYNSKVQEVNQLVSKALKEVINPLRDPLLAHLFARCVNSNLLAPSYSTYTSPLWIPQLALDEILGMKQLPLGNFHLQHDIIGIHSQQRMHLETLVSSKNLFAHIPAKSFRDTAYCIELAYSLIRSRESTAKLRSR